MTFGPALNACLNSLSAFLLVCGYFFIRQKKIACHRACMLGAVASSSLFLFSYLWYHAQHGSTHFTGQGAARAAYLVLLVSHSILAAAIVPLVICVLYFALKNKIPRHKHLARITLPLWLYVSVTGVVIYFLLY